MPRENGRRSQDIANRRSGALFPGAAAPEVAVLAVVTGNLDRQALWLERRVQPHQVPFVDPRPYVLTHPGGAEPLQSRDVGRIPAERVGVQVLQRDVRVIELVVVGRL